MAQGQLELQDPVRPLGDLGQALAQPDPGLVVHELGERPAEQVGLGIAEHPGHGLADVLDAGVGVDQDDDLARVLDQGLEALLGGAQLGRGGGAAR